MSNELETSKTDIEKLLVNVEKPNTHLSVEADEPFLDPKAPIPVAAAKLPSLLRKAGRGAAVYAASYLAVKALDKAAETHPGDKLINGADQIANVVFGFENLAVGGTILIAEAGYDALAGNKAAQPTAEASPAAPLPPKPTHKHHRSRANLNAALAPKDNGTGQKSLDLNIDQVPLNNSKATRPNPKETNLTP